jgi:hypothetical protein
VVEEGRREKEREREHESGTKSKTKKLRRVSVEVGKENAVESLHVLK